MPAACQSWILVPFPESEPDLAPAARMRTRSLSPHGPGTCRDRLGTAAAPGAALTTMTTAVAALASVPFSSTEMRRFWRPRACPRVFVSTVAPRQ